MNGAEIREKIIKNNKFIIENTQVTTFTLNKKIRDAIEENKRLRNICPHEYDELGFCIYCDTQRK